MINRKVYSMIREVLRDKKALRREDVYVEVANRFKHYEGDIGKRMREMPDVICTQTSIEVNGKRKPIWLYSLTGVKRRAA